MSLKSLFSSLCLMAILVVLPACDSGGGTSTVSPPSATPTPVSE